MTRSVLHLLTCLTVAVLVAVGAPTVAGAAGPPVVTTGGVSGLTTTTATLAGTANPDGLPTTVAFDYGTSTAYGSSTAVQSAGTGTGTVDVTAALTGLTPNTTYHYRIAAANAAGTDAGEDRTFRTPSRPSVASQAATAVTGTSATIGASVNPRGAPTSVVFDYGTSTAYGSSTPAQAAGEGTTAVTLKATIAGLRPGTTYHFRARATNASGTTNGSDRTFTTTATRRPAVSTGSVRDLTSGSATITGSVDPNGRPTTVVAQIGPTTGYGAQTAPVSVGSGDASVAVRLPVNGLRAATRYHFRLVATSDGGTVRGADRTFTTPRIPNVLTLSASPSRVVFGRSTTLRAVLGGTGAGSTTLNLFASPFPFTGDYVAFAPGLRTDGRGAAETVITPRRTTRYRGTATTAGQSVTSNTLRVTVVPSVTVRVAARPGGRVRFSGVIRPRGNATVSLRRVLGDGRTVTIERTRALRIPGASFARYATSLGRRTGRYLVHVKPDTTGLAAGDSKVVRVSRR